VDFHNTRYRKSYICFYKIGIRLLSLSTTSSLFISWYGAGIIEILAKRLKISERIEEYKSIYNFYRVIAFIEVYLKSNISSLTETSESLIRFQEFYNLSTDGTLNKETLDLIDNTRCGVKDNPTAYRVHNK
jgi:hypothetical protein